MCSAGEWQSQFSNPVPCAAPMPSIAAPPLQQMCFALGGKKGRRGKERGKEWRERGTRESRRTRNEGEPTTFLPF